MSREPLVSQQRPPGCDGVSQMSPGRAMLSLLTEPWLCFSLLGNLIVAPERLLVGSRHSDFSVCSSASRCTADPAPLPMCLTVFSPPFIFFSPYDYKTFYRVSCSSGWHPTLYVAKDDLQILVLPILPPKSWDGRHVSCITTPAFCMLEMDPQGLVYAEQLLYSLGHIPAALVLIIYDTV